MHPCLRIPEILDHICDEVETEVLPVGKGVKREAQLFALAQTCRDFHQPAIARLWEHIYNLVPIIKCAGRDIWSERSWDLELTRQLSPSNIEVMKKYARLVRHFGPDHEIYSPLAEVWESLQLAFKDTILFPSLRTLELNTIHALAHVGLFHSQNMTRIVFWFHGLNSSGGLPLTDLSTQCPNLTSISVREYRASCYQEDLIAALSHWPNLSRFDLPYAEYELSRKLSQHPTPLRVITMEIQHWSEWPESPAGNNSLVFPALEKAHIHFKWSPGTIQFFNCLSAPNLDTLSILFSRYWELPGENGWLELLSYLTKFSRSLKKLRFGDKIDYESGDKQITPLPGTLIFAAIATHFTRLTHLELYSPRGFAIMDEDVRKLTEALPLLETYHTIDELQLPRTTHDTTILSLVHFAQNCPSLLHLTFEFDARSDKLPQQLECTTMGSKLKWLSIRASPADDPERVASILRTIFPNMQKLYSDYLRLKPYSLYFMSTTYSDFTHTHKNPPGDEICVKTWLKIRKLLEVRKEGRWSLESYSQNIKKEPHVTLRV